MSSRRVQEPVFGFFAARSARSHSSKTRKEASHILDNLTTVFAGELPLRSRLPSHESLVDKISASVRGINSSTRSAYAEAIAITLVFAC